MKMASNLECVFIVNSLLNDDELGEIVSKYKDIINKNEGSVEFSEEWGRRRLAYPIKKMNRGYYYLYYFTGSGNTVSEIQRQVSYDEKILRCFICKVKDLKASYEEFVALKNEPEMNLNKYKETFSSEE